MFWIFEVQALQNSHAKSLTFNVIVSAGEVLEETDLNDVCIMPGFSWQDW